MTAQSYLFSGNGYYSGLERKFEIIWTMNALKNTDYIKIKERVKMGAWFARFEN